MLTRYLQAAMHQARYEILPEDGTYYGEIPACNGVFANAETLESCREQLEEVLEDWIFLRIHHHLPLPEIDGLELAIQKAAPLKTTVEIEEGLREIVQKRRQAPRFKLRDASFRGKGLRPEIRDGDWDTIRDHAR